MKITSKQQWTESRKISNRLASKMRAATASSEEAAEYHARNAAERGFVFQQPALHWAMGKSCADLGLMP